MELEDAVAADSVASFSRTTSVSRLLYAVCNRARHKDYRAFADGCVWLLINW